MREVLAFQMLWRSSAPRDALWCTRQSLCTAFPALKSPPEYARVRGVLSGARTVRESCVWARSRNPTLFLGSIHILFPQRARPFRPRACVLHSARMWSHVRTTNARYAHAGVHNSSVSRKASGGQADTSGRHAPVAGASPRTRSRLSDVQCAPMPSPRRPFARIAQRRAF